MFTKEQQKKNAVRYLGTIGCYKPYLKAYKDKGIVTMYEGFSGYYLDPADGSDETELIEKIHEIEEAYGGTIYAVIHNIAGFGELYTMLWSGKYEEDEAYSVEDYGDGSYGVFAWVWNKTNEDCSEFGTVQIKPALGGLLRIA